MKKTEKYRMYFLTLYNISEIQKGIQCGHAALEYANKFSKTEAYKHFIKHDKTWVILNGGVSNNINLDTEEKVGIGTMEQHMLHLKDIKIDHVVFHEPDLNNSLTSICFLVPNSVFNRIDYPDFNKWITNDSYPIKNLTLEKRLKLREMYFGSKHDNLTETYNEYFDLWTGIFGDKKFGLLRFFINKFKLA